MRKPLSSVGTLVGVALAISAGSALSAGVAHAAIPKAIAAAVADPARPEEDRSRDANRKPAESLEFAGVKPGETVADFLPGGGYFTRLFSVAVGPKGHVYAVAPPKRPNAAADAPEPSAKVKAIAADPHYSNVTVLVTRPADFALPAPVDLVWTSQNYHDVHNVANIDMLAFNKAVFNALKPGGVYIVLDHAAEPGSGPRDTSTLHRIDEATVKQEVEAAGFKLDGESKILRNPDDPHTAKVFDPSIQGKTDQFILKFRKPK